MAMQLIFYTRPNCLLCEEAKRTLNIVQQDIFFTLQELNIEDDDALHEKYMLMVPVVEKDGVVLQYGNIDYVTILEALGS